MIANPVSTFPTLKSIGRHRDGAAASGALVTTDLAQFRHRVSTDPVLRPAGRYREPASGNQASGTSFDTGKERPIGNSASTLVQHNAFEMKPAKLTIINTGYQLALFLAMSLVLGLL